MVQRKRDVQIVFRVSEDERKMIEEKMVQVGTNNLAAYLRKIAIDGYIVKLEVKEIQELSSLLRRYNANLNQIAMRLNTTGRIYDVDMEDISQQQLEIMQGVHSILTKLSAL